MATASSGSELIPADEVERYRDAEWALHDTDVQQQYHGRWVVAYERRVIADAEDPNDALAIADHLITGQYHLAVFCAVEDPASLLDHTSDIGP
jgi:hypothetical protein